MARKTFAKGESSTYYRRKDWAMKALAGAKKSNKKAGIKQNITLHGSRGYWEVRIRNKK